VLDVALIAQVTLRDKEVRTVEARERAEREDRRREEAARAAERAAEAKREAKRAAAIRAKEWPKDVESAVIQRKVAVGMTPEQVRFAWGAPTHINETTWATHTREQWVYSLSHYVYFANGRVVAIQTSR